MKLKIPLLVYCAAAIAAICPCSAYAQQGSRWVYTSVKSYGAVGNGIDPDTSAIDQAIAAGTAVYFPPGTYLYVGRLTLPANTSYRLFGDGPGVSTILFTATNTPRVAGIYGPTLGQATLNVEGLTLKANSKDCGTAIDAIFGPNVIKGTFTGKFHTATIHNVQILGSDRDGINGTWWTRGIHLYDGQASVIDKVEISGNKNATQTGILWDTAPSLPDFSTGIQLSNLQIKWCNTALATAGHVEGLYMTGFEFISCGRGGLPAIKLGTGGAFHIVNGQIDAIGNGMELLNFNEAKISNVYFRHNPSSETDEGTMLAMTGVTDVTVSECTFYGAGNGSQNENGILVIDSNSVRIDGNNFSHMQPTAAGTCIGVLGTSNVVRITDNLFSDVRQQYHPNPLPSPGVYTLGNNPEP